MLTETLIKIPEFTINPVEAMAVVLVGLLIIVVMS